MTLTGLATNRGEVVLLGPFEICFFVVAVIGLTLGAAR